MSNRWYWAGIILVLTTTAGAIGYLYTPSEPVEAEFTKPVEIPIPQVVQADKEAEPELMAARSELAERLAEQEQRLAQAQELASAEAELANAPETEKVVSEQVVAKEVTASEPPEAPQPASVSVPEPEPEPEAQQEVAPTGLTQGSEPSLLEQQPSEVNQLPPGAELESALLPESASLAETESQPELPEPKPVQQIAESSPQTLSSPSELGESAPAQTSSRFSADIESVLGWPATDVTVQLLAAREEQTADKLIARYGAATPMLKLSYPFKGAPRFTVVTGHYPSRAAANQAVLALPVELQRLNPWIRSVTGLKSELNSALNP